MVKRWVNEAQEASTSDHVMVQVCVYIYYYILCTLSIYTVSCYWTTVSYT